MTPTVKMTALAEAATERYGHLVDTWRSLYNEALHSHQFGRLSHLNMIIEKAYQAGEFFIASEMKHIEDASEEIVSDARGLTLAQLASSDTADFPDALREHLNDAISYLRHELSVQIERDIAYLRQSIRRAILQVRLAARAKGISDQQALIQYLASPTDELKFFFHDRRSTKWSSRKFVRAVWRLHLLTLYNETVLMTLADHGLNFAEVQHANPGADSNGMRVALYPGTDWVSYAEIRNEIFHPNSDAILRMEAPDVRT